MTRLGMDVDAAEQIGRGLQSDADQLAALTAKVDACVRGLAGVWQGRDASDFVGLWTGGAARASLAVGAVPARG